MRTILACLTLVSITALGAACSQRQLTLEETVQQFLDENGIAPPADCGDVDLDLACTSEPPKEVKCLLDAYASCKPVRLTTKKSSIEGDPIYTEYVVAPGIVPGDCSVEMFVDTTQDQFGDKTISERFCAAPVGDATCDNTLSASGCGDTCGGDCGR